MKYIYGRLLRPLQGVKSKVKTASWHAGDRDDSAGAARASCRIGFRICGLEGGGGRGVGDRIPSCVGMYPAI